jgi:hypothetical protein
MLRASMKNDDKIYDWVVSINSNRNLEKEFKGNDDKILHQK